MKIRNFHIHFASTIKAKLIDTVGDKNKIAYHKVLQIYQCRIFGLCIYRGEWSTVKLYAEIIQLAHENKKSLL
jgi:hypothetical protein